jgi:hypothetical protein
LILCQEIHDILSHAEYDYLDIDIGNPNTHFHEEKVVIGKPDPEVEQLKKKFDGRESNQSIPEEEEKTPDPTVSSRLQRTMNKQKKEDAYQSTVLTKRLTNDPALDAEEMQSQFLDDCFGEGVIVEHHLDKAVN